jgi:hypothetical protein
MAIRARLVPSGVGGKTVEHSRQIVDFDGIAQWCTKTEMNIANRVVNKIGAMPFFPDPNHAMEHDCNRVIKTKNFKLKDSLLTHAS